MPKLTSLKIFSGGLGQFTSIDADGDTYEWEAYDYGDGQETLPSASWAGTPLTPDNWLISSAIDLSVCTDLCSWL